LRAILSLSNAQDAEAYLLIKIQTRMVGKNLSTGLVAGRTTMTAAKKQTWTEILRQIPTITLITIVFISGGWKKDVDDGIATNTQTLCEYNIKGEALQDRVIELEAIVREYRAQAVARDNRLNEMNAKIDLIYQMMLEDRQ